MTGIEAPARVLSIDDDPEIRELVAALLTSAGYEVVSASDGPSGLRAAREQHPGLILLDIMMPRLNGYGVCDELQTDLRTADIPVVFLTALGQPQDKARALSLGATEYLTKPFDRSSVLACVRRNLAVSAKFRAISEDSHAYGSERVTGAHFMRFKPFLLERLPHLERVEAAVNRMGPGDMYAKAASACIDACDISQLAAEFLGLEHVESVSARVVELSILPASYCRSSLVVPVTTATGPAFVVANPFDLELQEMLAQYSEGDGPPRLIVAAPRTVLTVLGAVSASPAPGRLGIVSRPAPAPAVARATRPSGTPLRILVVDDDPDAQAATARLVEGAGHVTTVVAEGASALVQLARQDFDLVLADLEMPTLGGFALLDVMRKQNLRVPVVFVTGSTTSEDEAAAHRLGAAGFVHKPVRRDALLSVVASCDRRIREHRGAA